MVSCRWNERAWIAVAALVLLAGCGLKHVEIDPAVRNTADTPAAVPELEGLSLYLAPPDGPKERLWYENEGRRWTLERPPDVLVREALVKGLEGMGLTVSDREDSETLRLEVRIRWFAPYGHTPYAAVVILSLSLHPGEGEQALWWGRLRAGRVEPPRWLFFGSQRKLETIVSEVLTEAIDQLRWKPGFRAVVSRSNRR